VEKFGEVLKNKDPTNTRADIHVLASVCPSFPPVVYPMT